MSSQYSAYPGTAGAYGPYSGPASSMGGSADPIISRLRPRDLVGVIDQAFRLYRKHFLTFLAIIAVVHIPLQGLIQAASVFLIGGTTRLSSSYYDFESSPSTINEAFTSEFVLIGVVYGLSLLYSILMSVSQAALTASVADSHLDRPVSFGGAYSKVFKRIGPVLGLMMLEILIYLAALVPAILVLLIGIGAAVTGSSSSAAGSAAALCLVFPLIFAAIVFIIIVMVRLQVAVPALIVENLGPVQAVRRSWQLLNGYWWRTAGLLLILYVINLIVASGPAALVAGLATIFIKYDLVLNQAISGAVTVLTTAVFIPVQLVATTLYYFDTRVRREGFDIETAVSQAYPNAYPQEQGQYYPQGQPQQQYGSPAYTQPLGNGGYAPQAGQQQYGYGQQGQWTSPQQPYAYQNESYYGSPQPTQQIDYAPTNGNQEASSTPAPTVPINLEAGPDQQPSQEANPPKEEPEG